MAQIKGLHVYPSHGIYLGRIDFSANGFIRVNFGCPRENLKKAFDRVKEELRKQLLF